MGWLFNSGLSPYSYIYNFGYDNSGIVTIIAIILVIAMWKLFEKANKPGWAAIIPVYNLIVLYQIAHLSPWLLILFLIPIVNLIAIPILYIVLQFKLADSFAEGVGFAFGLLFLGFIFYPILAFSNAKYVN